MLARRELGHLIWTARGATRTITGAPSYDHGSTELHITIWYYQEPTTREPPRDGPTFCEESRARSTIREQRCNLPSLGHKLQDTATTSKPWPRKRTTQPMDETVGLLGLTPNGARLFERDAHPPTKIRKKAHPPPNASEIASEIASELARKL